MKLCYIILFISWCCLSFVGYFTLRNIFRKEYNISTPLQCSTLFSLIQKERSYYSSFPPSINSFMKDLSSFESEQSFKNKLQQMYGIYDWTYTIFSDHSSFRNDFQLMIRYYILRCTHFNDN
ncbi:hypothetical protein KM1_037990 [Entamoeba histolytica HM-3:IMSS]|uniref:Uncharacterized protein n=5 Tax=Entamoeba histolytica TaxID=5759 RepID=A0A175JPW8_ENTHI|nr:hypothetical protein KM1_037990 [Entamoeba histolytica HM-3:IMSS]ENY62468.1 unknown protein, putative [Entamoeba histolytica HM-1:IMSS-A]GAT95525.1 hypothetical protein CL6EHI_079985 [Entamoeba histolytica]